MMTFLESKWGFLPVSLLWAAIATYSLGCSKSAPLPTGHSSGTRQDVNSPTIDRSQAIELALENYKQVFGELASRGEVPGEWIQLVAPSRGRFEVTQTPDTWELVHDGNVGLVAHAKVDKKSGLVQWSLVAIAHE